MNKVVELFKEFTREEQRDILAILENSYIKTLDLNKLYSYSKNVSKENTQFLKNKNYKLKKYYQQVMIRELSARVQKYLYFLESKYKATNMNNNLLISHCVKENIDKYIKEKNEIKLLKEIRNQSFKSLNKTLKHTKIYNFFAESKEKNSYGLKLLKVEPTTKEIHIFVNGFLNDKKSFVSRIAPGLVKESEKVNFDNWIANIESINLDKTTLYGYSWPSSNGLYIGKSFIKSIDNNVYRLGAKFLIKAVSEWKKARDNAEIYGQKLAQEIEKIYKQDSTIKIHLYGHSLGARVIYYALDTLSTKDISIEEVFFFGGAVHIDEISLIDILRFTKNIYNFYSLNDDILRFMYKGAEIGEEPIGLNELKYKFHKEAKGNLCNFNVSEFIKGHTKYIENFHILYKRKYRTSEYCQ